MSISSHQLFCLDYSDFFGLVEDQSVDLAIVDPPYNLKQAAWDDFDNQSSFFSFTYDWIDRLIPKLKNTASIYIFNTPYNSAFILAHMIKHNFIFQNWIVWDKRDGFNYARKRYVSWQETILFFTKSKSYTFNPDQIRIPYPNLRKKTVKNSILQL